MNDQKNYFFSGLKGGSVIIWDLESGKIKSNFQAHKTIIKTLYTNKKDFPSLLASGSSDGKIKLWDTRIKTEALKIKGHLDSVNCITISPDSFYLASGSKDNLVKLWDLRQNKLLKDLSVPEQTSVNCLEFNPHSLKLAYGSSDKIIRNWDLEKFELISVTPIDKLPATKIIYDDLGKNIFVGTNDNYKYWVIDNKPELIDVNHVGWNNLQDLCYKEETGLYGKFFFFIFLKYFRFINFFIKNFCVVFSIFKKRK